MASGEVKRARKGLNMAGDDDDYGDAFKKARLEHDQHRESPTAAKRLQAEADADAAAMSDVVLPQLQAAALKFGAPWWQSRHSAVRSHRKEATARVGSLPRNRSAGSARSAGPWKGPRKSGLFDCSAGGNGNRHERQRFRHIRSSEATQERERGGRHSATQ